MRGSGRATRASKRFKDHAFADRLIVPCALCGHPLIRETATVDHILPRAQGGSHCRANLRIICWQCNRALANRQNAAKPWQIERANRRALSNAGTK